MAMSEWINIQVDTRALEDETKHSDGVVTRSWPSPYDVPEAARAIFDDAKKRLRILFKYLNEESFKREDDDNKDGISFGTGRNSKRLYEITVDMEKLKEPAPHVDDIASLINKDIEVLCGKYEMRTKNYKLVEQAILKEKENLLARAAAADANLTS
jgi:hypothetical protein